MRAAWSRWLDVVEEYFEAVQAAFIAFHVFCVLLFLVAGLSGRWPWWTAAMALVIMVAWTGLLGVFVRRRRESDREADAFTQVDHMHEDLRADRRAAEARTAELRAGDERLAAMQAGFDAAHAAPQVDSIAQMVEVCVRIERDFQRARWDDQQHADVAHPSIGVDTIDDEGFEGVALDEGRVARAHGVPTEEVAKYICQAAFNEGRGTWAHILVEEVAEAIAAGARRDAHGGCYKGTLELEAELYQVAAVAMSWAAASRRRRRDAAAVAGEGACEESSP